MSPSKPEQHTTNESNCDKPVMRSGRRQEMVLPCMRIADGVASAKVFFLFCRSAHMKVRPLARSEVGCTFVPLLAPVMRSQPLQCQNIWMVWGYLQGIDMRYEQLLACSSFPSETPLHRSTVCTRSRENMVANADFIPRSILSLANKHRFYLLL